MEDLSLSGYFLGIMVAVATFLAKEWVAYFLAGERYRRRIVTYAGSLVEAYESALPDLEALIGNVAADREGGHDPIRWAFQWDGPPPGVDHLFVNSPHLGSEAMGSCSKLYDALERADRIRSMYNQSVVVAVSPGPGQEGAIKIAATCLADLEWEYLEVLEKGFALLVTMGRNYPLLDIEIRPIQERAAALRRRKPAALPTLA